MSTSLSGERRLGLHTASSVGKCMLPSCMQMVHGHLEHVFNRGALLDSQVGHIEPLAAVPPHLQLLLGELQQVIQGFVIDLTV